MRTANTKLNLSWSDIYCFHITFELLSSLNKVVCALFRDVLL